MYYIESHNRILQFRNNSNGLHLSTFQAMESIYICRLSAEFLKDSGRGSRRMLMRKMFNRAYCVSGKSKCPVSQ